MTRSMTGYGSSFSEINGKKITVELRSLNSKQVDINTKMPWHYKEKEIEIRSRISKGIVRGKADLNIFVDSLDDQDVPSLNKTAIKSYYRQLTDVAGELYIGNRQELLSIIMRLPDTLKADKQKISDEEWRLITDLLDRAIKKLNEYRLEEGKSIENDLREKISLIKSYLSEIEPFESERIIRLREKLNNSLKQLKNEDIDQNRLEQEILYYLEKFDINEEKVRLAKHCEYFLQTMGTETASGKKLGFIAQEMGREINTLGSKANNVAIQKIIVMMKDELEKIKEQILNVL